MSRRNVVSLGHPNVLPRGLVGAEELLHLLGLVVGAVLEPEGWRNLVDAAFFKRVGVVVAAHFEVEDCSGFPAHELEVDVRPHDVDLAVTGDIKLGDDRIVQEVLQL